MMTDSISAEHRSWNMSRIKSRDTKPERTLRSLLHRAGFRFRLHVKELPGRPDIVLPRYRTAIFVHGCFWHRHEGCRNTTTPSTRAQFWQDKFDANIDRDKRNVLYLEQLGWRVETIWECDLGKDAPGVVKRLSEILRGTH